MKWPPAALLLVLVLQHVAGQDLCAHENDAMVANSTEIQDGSTVYRQIGFNMTHKYYYANYNESTYNLADANRKLIINLEPCTGVVYLFVRKTRPCWPNPYSCLDLRPTAPVRAKSTCDWTHFMSVIDGSRDGAPTFFEVPLSTTRYYISVFAAESASYTLTLISDIGQFPRPGNQGLITAEQKSELEVQLSWDAATTRPLGVSNVWRYWIYSAMLLEIDNRTNTAVFLRKDKVLNTVCGLQNNTDTETGRLPATLCESGKCTFTVDGVVTKKRYVFNIIAETEGGYMMAYAGLILSTDWEVETQAASPRALQVIGAVGGSVLGLVIIGYLWLLMMFG